MALLNLQNISLSFGSPLLLDNINVQIHSGEKICLLGRNGSGKSSLMKIIDKEIEPDTGILIHDKNFKTALLSQDIPESLPGTIYQIIAGGIDPHETIEQHVGKVLSLISLDPDLEFNTLSAGMKRRVLLGRALVNDPDILLLDEPTNHLDIDSIKWLEDFLYKYEKTIFFVTHDRIFLQKIATRIMELDRGNIYDWKCDYNTFLKRKDAWLESEETQNSLFDKKLAQEEVWIRKGIKARRTRNEGRVRALKKMREERTGRREQLGNVRMGIQQVEKSGKLVIEATDISFAYGSSEIINNFSTTILRGDKIGIIGPNGCGKSTLVKILVNEISPNNGNVKIGTKIEKAYFDQLRDQLDEDLSVKENVTDGNEIISFNGKNKHVIGYLEDFLFTPDRSSVKVKALSGGEKNRLLLAKLFTRPANLLILDEPTNDLDLETVELLEELLLDYEGTLLLVSHDRAFLNNVVTSTIAFEGDTFVKEYVGGYDDWISMKKNFQETKPAKKPRIKKAQDAKKLTFKEVKELESLPKILEEKEKRKDELFELMSNPSFYQESGDKVAECKHELIELEKELEILFKRWEELEEKNFSFMQK